MKMRLLIGGWMLGLVGLCCSLSAQVNASLAPVRASGIRLDMPTTAHGFTFQLPKHVQQNPMNHAPLCRMELQIERQLPVGVWMRADGILPGQATNPGLAYLRFKIPLKN
jgi:hypothetical protein